MIERKAFDRPAVIADNTTQLGAIAVDLRDRLTSRDLVQAVDVLRNDVLEPPHLFEVAQGEVSRIRRSRFQCLRQFGEAASALLTHLPPPLRVLDEPFVVSKVRLA